MTNRFAVTLLMALATCCSLGGCSRSDRLETYPVRGKVTYRNKPVADASVAFLAPRAPRMAVGKTDAEGNFSLTTFEPDDGAIAGTHVVTVRKVSAASAGPAYVASPDGRIDSAAIERAMQETARQLAAAEKSGSGLPSKYADHMTSDLRLEVAPQENEFQIQLVD